MDASDEMPVDTITGKNIVFESTYNVYFNGRGPMILLRPKQYFLN